MAAVGQTEGRPAERTLFGHPVGLANLFGVELWERFSFYGMLTILGYYLYYTVTDGGLELPKATATGIVEPITGSQIDERSLGQVPSAAYADVAASAHAKCERCWHYRPDVDDEALCGRCRSNLHGPGEKRLYA